MDVVKGEVVETGERGPLDGNTQANKGVVDGVAAVTFAGILSRGPNGEVPEVGKVTEGVDKGGHVGGGMEEWRVLLGEDLAELRVGILRTRKDRGHGSVRRVEETYLGAGGWVDQGREEGGCRVGEGERQVLDLVAYPRQGLDPRALGEGIGRKGDVDPLK